MNDHDSLADIGATPSITRNFHTHTFRCKHASGDVADYVEEARMVGLRELGISDHTPLPDGWRLSIRMEEEELPGYLEAIRQAQQSVDDIRIYAGMECDYFARYERYYREELLGRHQLDYLIGSIHAIPWQGEDLWIRPGTPPRFMMDAPKLRVYAEQMIKAIESGLFAFIAHPDLFSVSLFRWYPEVRTYIREILSAAESYAVPLEINTSGFAAARGKPDRYMPSAHPVEQFWEEAMNYRITVVIGSDAHSPASLTTDMRAGYRIAQKYGLTEAQLPFALPADKTK